jgi:hypothetical protein
MDGSSAIERRQHPFIVCRQRQSGQLVRVTDGGDTPADCRRPNPPLGLTGQEGGK